MTMRWHSSSSQTSKPRSSTNATQPAAQAEALGDATHVPSSETTTPLPMFASSARTMLIASVYRSVHGGLTTVAQKRAKTRTRSFAEVFFIKERFFGSFPTGSDGLISQPTVSAGDLRSKSKIGDLFL